MDKALEKTIVDKFIKATERERILRGLNSAVNRKQTISQMPDYLVDYVNYWDEEINQDEFLTIIKMYVNIHEAKFYVMGDLNYDGGTIPFERAFEHMCNRKDSYIMVNVGPYGYTLIAKGKSPVCSSYRKYLYQTR